MVVGECVLDPSVTRPTLVSGYACMCIAAGKPYFGKSGGRILSNERLATAPLPDGWRLITEQERLWFVAFFEQRDTLRQQRADLNRRLTLKASRLCLSAAAARADVMCCVRAE